MPSIFGLGIIILDKCTHPLTAKNNRMMLFGLGFSLLCIGFFTTRMFMKMKLPDYLQHRWRCKKPFVPPNAAALALSRDDPSGADDDDDDGICANANRTTAMAIVEEREAKEKSMSQILWGKKRGANENETKSKAKKVRNWWAGR
ncbi:hypothetical protein niasHS_014147 [Heterodera schachtii]|uniref:Uncharacterized protein n=1 Tax=Heterodera schachtii TaxID=97005 RepID=A0ABD2IPV8_HETSC